MFKDFWFLRPVLAAVTILATASFAEAAIVQAHFNDKTNAALLGQSAGGTGLTGNWGGGSSNAVVGNGDLTAPAGTNFNLTQPTGNKRVEIGLTGADRQNRVDFATPLSGTIWGTFLVNNNNGGRAGIGINTADSASDFGTAPRLIVEGTNLVFITNTENANNRTVATGVVPATGDSLILFKTVFAPGRSNITIDAWANPDLLQPLPAPHVSATSTHPQILNNDFYRVAAGGRRPTGNDPNSLVDFITLSDGPNAFQDVTGRAFLVPEPASCVLLGIGLVAFCGRRVPRRRPISL